MGTKRVRMDRPMIEGDTRAQNRFRELLDAAPDAIIEANSEGRIVLVNEIAQRLFVAYAGSGIGDTIPGAGLCRAA